MTEDEFWDYVDQINWPQLVDIEARGGGDAIEMGKNRMLKLFPDQEDQEEFFTHYCRFSSDMQAYFMTWSDAKFADSNDPWSGWGTGDDSFGDLISHIIGCGKDVYEAEMADPNLAVKRVATQYEIWGKKAKAGVKHSDGFTEKFSYCFPEEDDYEAPGVKLAEVLESVAVWVARAASLVDQPGCSAHREVASLLASIAFYQKQINEGDTKPVVYRPTEEEYKPFMEEARIQILKVAFAHHAKVKIETIFKMKEIADELHSLGET